MTRYERGTDADWRAEVERRLRAMEAPHGPRAAAGDGGPPTGAAGGVLGGIYPDPGFAVDMATQDELDDEAAARVVGDAAVLAAALAMPQPVFVDFPATKDPGGASVVATVWINGLGWFARVLGKPLTITKLALSIGTSSGNLCVGVYANTGAGVAARPGARKGTSGAVASPGTGYREIALTGAVDVVPGDWFAVSADNGTITFVLAPNTNSYAASNNLVAWRGGFNLASHPLPDPAPALTGHGAVPIILGIA